MPEYREIVNTIAWGEEILAYHTSRRATNGPIEGINNLLQVLRRVAHGFTNYDNYAARGLLVT
ncbi:MAG: transposase [bacterium]|nr:transposase [bacterium]